MLTDLKEQPADKILQLMAMFREDPRERKIDLGVGVYRDAEGRTPVMRAVKRGRAAGLGDAGHQGLHRPRRRPGLRARRCAASSSAAPSRTSGSRRWRRRAAPARCARRSSSSASPRRRRRSGCPTRPGPTTSRSSAISAGRARPTATTTRAPATSTPRGCSPTSARARRGDVVVLHGCCHNPTGADPDARYLGARSPRCWSGPGAIPLVDIAYQGFGNGLDEDAAGTRLLAARLPEVLIAASCSKNFGVYRERTGALMAVAPDAASARLSQGTLALPQPAELLVPARPRRAGGADGARHARAALRLGDRARGHPQRHDRAAPAARGRAAAAHQLRPLRLPRPPSRHVLAAGPRRRALVATLREGHGIYLVGDSRMNVAGLNRTTVPIVAAAIAGVLD